MFSKALIALELSDSEGRCSIICVLKLAWELCEILRRPVLTIPHYGRRP